MLSTLWRQWMRAMLYYLSTVFSGEGLNYLQFTCSFPPSHIVQHLSSAKLTRWYPPQTTLAQVPLKDIHIYSFSPSSSLSSSYHYSNKLLNKRGGQVGRGVINPYSTTVMPLSPTSQL